MAESTFLTNQPNIKLRNLPTSYSLHGGDPEANVLSSSITRVDPSMVGGVYNLIGLTYLHDQAILHALQLHYYNSRVI